MKTRVAVVWAEWTLIGGLVALILGVAVVAMLLVGNCPSLWTLWTCLTGSAN